jgi:predicted nucleic acid-binding protein
VQTLFDSNILIDALKGIPAAIEAIAGTEGGPAISVITRIEVLAGCPNDRALAAARTLISKFTVLQLSPAVEAGAIELRRTTRLKLPDAIILATARAHGLTLATRNTRDFPEADPATRVPYRL